MIIEKKAFYSSLHLYNEIKNYNVTELQNITNHLCDLVIYKWAPLKTYFLVYLFIILVAFL